jgi:hypothetical protein
VFAGDRGLIGSDCGSVKYPAYHVVQSLAAAAAGSSANPFGGPAQLLQAESAAPGTVASLGLSLDGGQRRQLWLANLTPTQTTVAVDADGYDEAGPSSLEVVTAEGTVERTALQYKASDGSGSSTIAMWEGEVVLDGYGVVILTW